MKWFLILYYVGGLNGGIATTAIGPYDDRDSCVTVAQIASKDQWRVFCYPVGKVEVKAPTPPAATPAPPAATPQP